MSAAFDCVPGAASDAMQMDAMQMDAMPLDEQMVWLRHHARVQQRVSETVRQMAARIEALEADLLRHRAQAVLERTAQWWAIPLRSRRPWRAWPGVQPGVAQTSVVRLAFRGQTLAQAATLAPAAAPDAAPDAWRASDQVLCQTACVGHAHHWLGPDGQCQRKGGDCERVQATGDVDVSGT